MFIDLGVARETDHQEIDGILSDEVADHSHGMAG